MDNKSLAPCGVICDLCLGFQRIKNKCVGCNNEGPKPYHCTVCSIKQCKEKNGNYEMLCSECKKFPCRKIKDLNKRYIIKYGEDLILNFKECKEDGIISFIESKKEYWKCKKCGELLCVHRELCMNCDSINPYYPKEIEEERRKKRNRRYLTIASSL
jgi:hypothetical protein